MDLSRVTEISEIVGPTGMERQVSKKEDIPHKMIGVTAVILLRDGEDCSQAEKDGLRDGLCREFSTSREWVAIAAFRAGREQEPPK